MITVNQTIHSSSKSLKNTYFKARFNDRGKLLKMENFVSNFSQFFQESYSSFSTSNYSGSDTYLSNPSPFRSEIEFNTTKMLYFELPGIASIIQVIMKHSYIQILKTHIVYQDGDVNLQKQLYTQIQVSNYYYQSELSYNLKKVHKSSDSTFKAYVDDSMKLVERPFFNESVEIKTKSHLVRYGNFTSSCVHGGIIRETYDSESFFGWANSKSMGCGFYKEGQVNFIVSRSTMNRDENNRDEDFKNGGGSSYFQLFIDNSLSNITNLKLAGNAKLNEPLIQYGGKLGDKNMTKMHYSGSLLEYTLNSLSHETQLSKNFGEVDVVDAKIMKHNMIKKHQSYEIDIVLRNRFGNYVKIDKANAENEGIFKNHYIDTFKNTKSKDSGYKINPDKKILSEDRYDLQVLETEVSTKIFEMQFFYL